MKEVFRRIVLCLMTFIVLFSTMSFTINSHYCSGVFIDSSFFVEAYSCGMEQSQQTNKEKDFIFKRICCYDESTLVEGQNILENNIVEMFSFDPQFLFILYSYDCIKIPKDLYDQIIAFRDLSPPFFDNNIYVFNEVFLI